VKKHTKIYMQFFDYGEQDFVMCEFCQQDRAVDVHHIQSRGMGGSKEKDFIENLMGLCRECHIKAESDSSFNMFCRIKHLENVCHQIYGRIEYEKRFNK
jgi:5-methylcytosine-specific restriction endonuclease McrA